MNNIILQTDSYKLNHWNQYPHNTKGVFSYFESRRGAQYPETVFFGLQAIIKKNLLGRVVSRDKIEQAAALSKAHFGSDKYFNREGWEYILREHDGRLPIRIKAVSEGKAIPTDNVLMTVENTDTQSSTPAFSLTNALESLLTHVWYPSTVATLSRSVKKHLKSYLDKTAETNVGLNFGLHDFGYRGVSSDESAEFGGAAHLVNFMGTDTVPAMQFIVDYYGGNPTYENIAYSVAATEHSVMTARGRDGEEGVVNQLLEEYPTGILSVVADSYDIYNFVEKFVGETFREHILAREGVFVIRPDSITPEHPTPESEVVWILNSLWKSIGGIVNPKGYKVINPKVRVLWGDGIDEAGINRILDAITANHFSSENMACFGMGGGLLQKVNRDTQRFAFKSSAQLRAGVWHDIYKDPKDKSKASKKGRLKLVGLPGVDGYETVKETDARPNELVTVFENGELLQDISFETVRKNAAL